MAVVMPLSRLTPQAPTETQPTGPIEAAGTVMFCAGPGQLCRVDIAWLI